MLPIGRAISHSSVGDGMGEDIMKMMKDNKWFWIVLSCVLLWTIIIAWFVMVVNIHAEGKMISPEEIAEEEYYDSLELLAVCVEAEAGNQDLDGKRMVVDVILNRVDDLDWPDTITGVITEKKAFSSYWNGAMDNVWEPSEETFQAVRMELENRSWPGIYYFSAEGYSQYGTPWKKVGDHYFSTK